MLQERRVKGRNAKRGEGQVDSPVRPTPIRVVLACRPSLLRDGIRHLLAQQADVAIVAEVETCYTADTAARSARPDVVVIEFAISSPKSLDRLQGQLLAGSGPRHIIVLSTGERGVDAAARLRRFDHVPATASPDTLLRAVRRGTSPVSSSSSQPQHVSSGGRGPTVATSARNKLTERELHVVRGVLDGKSNREIGGALNIREDTVKHHLMRIFDKTGVSSRLALAMLALEHHILEARASES